MPENATWVKDPPYYGPGLEILNEIKDNMADIWNIKDAPTTATIKLGDIVRHDIYSDGPLRLNVLQRLQQSITDLDGLKYEYDPGRDLSLDFVLDYRAQLEQDERVLENVKERIVLAEVFVVQQLEAHWNSSTCSCCKIRAVASRFERAKLRHNY